MLSVDTYTPEYVAKCRARVAEQVSAYQALLAAARKRTKDGNPLNEVRLLCESIMNNDAEMCADDTIKIDAAKSVLKYRVGDKIKLNVADFILLSSCFFAEIEEKYL